MGSSAITVMLGVVLAVLLADLVGVRLPAARARRRARPGVRSRRRGAPAPIEAVDGLRAGSFTPLPLPRRGQPRAEVTVAAVLGIPAVRAVAPLDRACPPPGRAVRRGPRPGPGHDPRTPEPVDRALLTACWDAASRRRARLVDAAAVELGLARDTLHPAPCGDADPLLVAARWQRHAA